MYKQYLKLQNCKLGQGVFTSVDIPANLPIMEMMGPVLLDREIAIKDYSDYIQIGPNTFMGLSGGFEDHFNHSCDPNCKLVVVGNRAILFSLYVISAGMELTFDYSTTSTDTINTWRMICQCGDRKCRKVVSGYQYLDEATKKNYNDKNMLPMYIANPESMQGR